jgi:predicted membrane-bound mannosyltransferase
LKQRLRACAYAAWLAAILALAALHALHLRADFPNASPWHADWAKYTDEGWYANAAIRAHLFGNWYQPGDFNPAAALPFWPALEWIAFSVAGVSLQAARGLAVFCFFANLALTYLLVRVRAARWASLLAVTLIAASPFLYCFSRLAILEPVLMTLTLAALNVAVRIGKASRPRWAAVAVGLLFVLMMLTKLTAVFFAPALAWAMGAALLQGTNEARRRLWPCAAIAVATTAAAYGAWMALIAHQGLLRDYRYLLFVNNYPKPAGFTWPLASFWWSLHGALWVDRALIPLAGVAIACAVLARLSGRAGLAADPVFGAAFWAVAGCILFMTYQDHPQPRYYAVVAYFCFVMIALGAASLVESGQGTVAWARPVGGAILAVVVLAAAIDSAGTVEYATHPQYTFANAARALTDYIDAHPNGRRMLVSVSGDEIMLATHLPALCDDFGTENLPEKEGHYQPGWYASWNDFDPDTLQDLHTRYSLEQVATYRAFDDGERNVLVLFKLHPLPGGAVREIDGAQNLSQPLPDDKIDVMIE